MRFVYALVAYSCGRGMGFLFLLFRVILDLLWVVTPASYRSNKHVIVIGGGFAGSFCADQLSSYFERVTLVDEKEYFEVSAIGFEERTIVTEAHGKLHYDYLCICSGTTYNHPIKENLRVKLSNRANTLAGCYGQLKTADSVLVIGGGIVGVELAAEIAERFPKLTIVICHSGKSLMDGSVARGSMPESVSAYALRWLETHNVKVILEERVVDDQDPADNRMFYTNKGRDISADLAFICTGVRPSSQFMAESDAECLDKNGYLRVEPTLQLQGHSNVFVAGDVAAVPGEKLAQAAEKTGWVVVENLRRLAYANLNAQGRPALVEYRSKVLPMLISLGKYDGIMVWGSKFSFTGLLPAIAKEFVEWKTMIRYRDFWSVCKVGLVG